MSQADMNNQGWIKLHRKLLENPIAQRSQYWHLWTFLLLKVSHKTTEFIWNGKKQTLKSGQLLTGRKQLSLDTGISGSTIERILSYLESEHQIEQQKTNKFRIIAVKNWEKYQNTQGGEQQADNKRTTGGQQVDIYKNEEECKRMKKKEDPRSRQIFDHWNSYKGRSICKRGKDGQEKTVAWKSHKPRPDDTLSPDIVRAISEALKDGHSVEEINGAIDHYAKILLIADYWWTHVWPLSTFLMVKYEKRKDAEHKWWQFLPDNFDEEKYMSEDAKRKRERRAGGHVPLDLVKKQLEQDRGKADEQRQTA